jgi:hypothetical protein
MGTCLRDIVVNCLSNSSLTSDRASHRLDGTLCLGEVARVGSRVSPQCEVCVLGCATGAGSVFLPTSVKRTRVGGQDCDPLLPPLIYCSAPHARNPAFSRSDKTLRSGLMECCLCEGFHAFVVRHTCSVLKNTHDERRKTDNTPTILYFLYTARLSPIPPCSTHSN